MKKLKVAIIQVMDDNMVRYSYKEKQGSDVFILSLNLKKWSEFHQYDHFIHYLTDSFKQSTNFLKIFHNSETNTTVENIDMNFHGKFLGWVKSLECLEEGRYDYVCMLDMDVGYVNWTRGLEDYLENMNLEKYSLIAGLEQVNEDHFFEGRRPNGGVYVFKNNDWTRRFLKGLILAQTRIGYSTHNLIQCMTDEMQMSYIAMVCPDCDEHFAITKYRENIQTIFIQVEDYDRVEALFYHFTGTHKSTIPLYLEKQKEWGVEIVENLATLESSIIKY